MRLVEKLVVEAIKEAEIVRGQFPALKRCDALRDFPALLAHAVRLTSPTQKHKPAPPRHPMKFPIPPDPIATGPLRSQRATAHPPPIADLSQQLFLCRGASKPGQV